MLQLVLLAVLVISCTCFQEYRQRYDPFNVYTTHTNDVFPNFELYGPQYPHLPSPQHAFLVNRYNSKGLTFKGEIEAFTSEGYHFVLHSFTFEFHHTGETRLIVKFRTLGNSRKRTVVSRVFIPPQNDLDQEHADAHAVHATSLTIDVPRRTKGSDRRANRDGICRIDWIFNILQKVRPKFLYPDGNNPDTQIYVGAPLIVKKKVLQGLKDLGISNRFLTLLDGIEDRYSINPPPTPPPPPLHQSMQGLTF